MRTSAKGQIFGYVLQFPRALLRLFETENDAKVVIEDFGDVAILHSNGSITTEEDKSSLSCNALLDLSSNLWKTFYNWIIAVDAGELKADRDHFVLYANHPVRDNQLIKLFSDTSEASVDVAVERALQVASAITKDHELYNYKNTILNTHLAVFKKILPRFELVEDRHADDVYPAIRDFLETKAFIPVRDVEWVLSAITGWFQTLIMTRIAMKQCACVTRTELHNYLQPLLEKVRTKELIDFAVAQIPTVDELSRRAGERPVYVRQLANIHLGDDWILEAVSDYFQADVNRLEWIEKGFVSEIDMEDFEKKLVSFHASEQKSIELTQPLMEEEKRGQLLLANCQKRQEKIAGKEPVGRIIQGSYHVLADEPRIGWHPRWQEVLKRTTDGGGNGATC